MSDEGWRKTFLWLVVVLRNFLILFSYVSCLLEDDSQCVIRFLTSISLFFLFHRPNDRDYYGLTLLSFICTFTNSIKNFTIYETPFILSYYFHSLNPFRWDETFSVSLCGHPRNNLPYTIQVFYLMINHRFSLSS